MKPFTFGFMEEFVKLPTIKAVPNVATEGTFRLTLCSVVTTSTGTKQFQNISKHKYQRTTITKLKTQNGKIVATGLCIRPEWNSNT
jgi:hypothetical protein